MSTERGEMRAGEDAAQQLPDGAPHPYGAVIVEHFRRPRNQRTIARPDVEAERVNALCGDRVRVSMALGDDRARIDDAVFAANACAICVAAASLLTETLRGRHVADAAAIGDDEALRMLEAPIPAGRRRCATLALEAARAALAPVAAHAAGVENAAGAAGARSAAMRRVAGIVLAAGTASRFGAAKVLAAIPDGAGGSVAMVRRVVDVLREAGVAPIVVTAGEHAAAIARALEGSDARTVVCAAFRDGMSNSIRAGLDALAGASEPWDDVLVALGDQPTLTACAVRAVCETDGTIVVPCYREGRGHPVRFHRSLADELARVRGDRGGREVVDREPARVVERPIDASRPADVDVPEDLETVRRTIDARRHAVRGDDRRE